MVDSRKDRNKPLASEEELTEYVKEVNDKWDSLSDSDRIKCFLMIFLRETPQTWAKIFREMIDG